MILSDEYETFPITFQALVPKSNPQIKEMMDIYRQGNNGLKFNKFTLGHDIMKKINDNPNSLIGKAHCDICHLALYSNKEVKKHKMSYHNPPYEECDNPRIPYRFCRNDNGYSLCLVYTCGWQHTNQMEIIKHMCLMHSQLELSNFGVSRMYLKYIMGIRLPEMDLIRQTQIDPLGHIS